MDVAERLKACDRDELLYILNTLVTHSGDVREDVSEILEARAQKRARVAKIESCLQPTTLAPTEHGALEATAPIDELLASATTTLASISRPADMDEGEVPSSAPRRPNAAPIKFEGELEYLNLLPKEEQRKARKNIAQQRRREAFGRAAEYSARATKLKTDANATQSNSYVE